MIKVHLSRILGEKRITMVELSKRAGVSKNTVRSLYHESAQGISWGTLEKLCKALECQPGDLLEFREEEK